MESIRTTISFTVSSLTVASKVNSAGAQFAEKIKAAYDFALTYQGQDVIKSANANVTVTLTVASKVTFLPLTSAPPSVSVFAPL